MKGVELTAVLRASELFGALDRQALTALAAHLEPVSVPGGQLVMRAGDPGDALYLVVSGRLRAVREGTEGRASDVILNEIGAGQVVGEVALLSDRPRAASVRAVRDSELLRLPAEAFRQLLRDTPDLLVPLSALLVERLSAPVPAVAAAPGVGTIAVVPARPESGAVAAAFAQDLQDALARLGPSRLVTAATVDAALGDGAAQRAGDHRGNAELVGLLQGFEQREGFAVYQADRSVSEWTRRCLRQADRILVVGEGSRRPHLHGLEGALPPDVATELVLVHQGAPPTRTAAWLEAGSFLRHHHVRAGQRADHARVARIVAGRAVGLVLGGGGPRGFVHLGVMRALEEARVPIDAVGGTSIGSIMGATYALGWDDRERVGKAVAAFVETKRLVPPTLPLVAFSSSRKLTALLRQRSYLGTTQIEDLWIRYFCISSNLTRDEMVVHERGPLWRAVRASISMPGVLPPVFDRGDLLVDGGIVNDLPVDVMRRTIAGTVIAVDLKPQVDPALRVVEPFEPTVSGWQVLLRRANPFVRSFDLPNPLALAMRAKEIGGRRAQRDASTAAAADLYLRPPAGGFDPLDFSNGRELVELGYRHAAEALAASPLLAALAER